MPEPAKPPAPTTAGGQAVLGGHWWTPAQANPAAITQAKNAMTGMPCFSDGLAKRCALLDALARRPWPGAAGQPSIAVGPARAKSTEDPSTLPPFSGNVGTRCLPPRHWLLAAVLASAGLACLLDRSGLDPAQVPAGGGQTATSTVAGGAQAGDSGAGGGGQAGAPATSLGGDSGGSGGSESSGGAGQAGSVASGAAGRRAAGEQAGGSVAGGAAAGRRAAGERAGGSARPAAGESSGGAGQGGSAASGDSAAQPAVQGAPATAAAAARSPAAPPRRRILIGVWRMVEPMPAARAPSIAALLAPAHPWSVVPPSSRAESPAGKMDAQPGWIAARQPVATSRALKPGRARVRSVAPAPRVR